jgi:hypothetical protein
MSRKNETRFKAPKQTRLEKRIAALEDECEHFEKMLKLDIDYDKRRVLWCRLEDNKVLLRKLRVEANKKQRRCKPAPEAPLFVVNGKEVK